MPPWFMALLFGSLAAIAVWSIRHDLVTGVASDDIWRFNADSNPGGYWSLLVGKAFVVVYGLATIGWALGLNANPFLMLKAALGPLAPQN
jgi:hypothetical protein